MIVAPWKMPEAAPPPYVAPPAPDCAVKGVTPSLQNETWKEAPPPPEFAEGEPAAPVPPRSVANTQQPPAGAIHAWPATVPSAIDAAGPTGSTVCSRRWGRLALSASACASQAGFARAEVSQGKRREKNVAPKWAPAPWEEGM
jgi:hypothetical protein